MSKKDDLPAMPFYIGDWKKDPAISVLTKEEKMIWLEIIFLMWESKERGYLTVNGKPMNEKMLAQSLGLLNQRLTECLTYFSELGLYSTRPLDSAIYSRKILHIVDLSNKRKSAGKAGGNPNLLKQRLNKVEASALTNAENENENEINNTNKIISNTTVAMKSKHWPNDLFVAAFNEFIEMRKKIRKPATERAKQIILNKLEKESTETATAMLEQSIVSSWADIYPLKNKIQSGKTIGGYKECEEL